MTHLKTAILGLALVAGLGLALPATAQQNAVKPDPVEQHNTNAFWFVNWLGLSNATLTVAAPNGKITKLFAKDGTPVFEICKKRLSKQIVLIRSS